MLLEASSLYVGYGDATAVWDVSFGVEEGEIISIVGPNGAGKTTLINAIAGLLRVQQGRLRISGTDMSQVRPDRFCSHGVALIPEGRRLFAGMTVEENLEIGCYRREARKEMKDSFQKVYARFPILRDKRHQQAGQLSGGQQQMVAIGRALMAKPRLLLFDEPSLGLAPSIVDELFDIILTVRDEGVAVLLVEQNVIKALRIADRAYVLEQGRFAISGVPADLIALPHIREAYLGI